MKQSTYILAYKDSPRAYTVYFGPFVDRDHAERFCAQLPEPLPGGIKTWKVTQPFTHEEADMASAVILAQREKLVANGGHMLTTHS